ncbi:hypothetical protein ABMD26_002413 [Pseudomonas sp. PvP001]|jgi:hypothetical protein
MWERALPANADTAVHQTNRRGLHSRAEGSPPAPLPQGIAVLL